MIEQDKAAALNAAFDRSGLTYKNRAETLSHFQQDHEIQYTASGEPETFFNGERQPLHLALKANYSEIHRDHIDGRSAPRKGAIDGVSCKADLASFKEKSAFIAKHGIAAFEALPHVNTTPSEVVHLEDFHKLPRPEKVLLITKNPNILRELKPRPTDQIKGSFIDHGKIAKEKALRGGR